MDRRYIPSLPTSPSWQGAYATKWDGFSEARIRYIAEERGLQKWIPRQIGYDDKFGVWGVDDIRNVYGVYVFLSKDNYVLYVGGSGILVNEIKKTYRAFEPFKQKYIYKVTAHRALSADLTDTMESDLLWYYTPPWNTIFKH